jgi:beta-phosphoglucomutase
MIKAVFFDLDDTLITALKCHSLANVEAFKVFGYDYMRLRKPTKDNQTHGIRVIDFLKIRKEGAGITEKMLPLKKLYIKRQQILMSYLEKYSHILPGAIHALKNSKENNCIVAIVSSGTNEYIDKLCEIFQLKPYIDFIVSGDNVNKGKPDPECYLKAYSRLQSISSIEKKECLVVEDAVNGVMSAKSAKLPVLYVPSKCDKNDKNIPVDYTLSSLEQFNILSINT